MEEREEIIRKRKRMEWADLPTELVEMIWKRMDYSRADALRLRSVCSTWRASLPPPSFQTETPPVILNHPSSWSLYLPPPSFQTRMPPDMPHFSCILKEVAICRIQLTTTDDHHNKQASTKSTTWLFKVVESSKGQLRLLHSLTNVQHNPRVGPLALSLDNASFVQVGSYFSLGSTKQCLCRRITLFPATARLTDKEFAVLAILDDGRLWHWRRRDDRWMLLDDRNVLYDDLAVRNGQCYVVDRTGTVSWINGNLSVVQYSVSLKRNRFRKVLVESRGELYVVDRFVPCELRPRYSVYRLNEERGEWEKVKSLGDRSFVLRADCSFSFDSTVLFGSGEGNCIYFTMDEIAEPLRWYKCRVSRLEDESVEWVVGLPQYCYGRLLPILVSKTMSNC